MRSGTAWMKRTVSMTTALAVLLPITGTSPSIAYLAHRGVVANSGSVIVRRSKEAYLNEDPKDHYGKDRDVWSYFDMMRYHLGPTEYFPISRTCSIIVQAVDDSHGMPALSTNKYFFLAAVITNPQNCDLGTKYSIGQDEVIALVVSLRVPPSNPVGMQPSIGESRFVRLDDVGNNYDLKYGTSSTVGRCGHVNSPNTGDAAIAYWNAGAGADCGTVNRVGLKAHAMQAELRTKIEKHGPFLNKDDSNSLSFWFACGTDCCFAEMN